MKHSGVFFVQYRQKFIVAFGVSAYLFISLLIFDNS